MEKFDFLMFLNKLYFNYFSALTKNLHRNMMHFEQQQAWSNYCYSIMQMSHMIAPPSASRRREEQRVGMPLKKEEPSNFYYLIIDLIIENEEKFLFFICENTSFQYFFQKPFVFAFIKQYFFPGFYFNEAIDMSKRSISHRLIWKVQGKILNFRYTSRQILFLKTPNKRVSE